MAATSKHYGDIALWVEKVTNSAKTFDQCKSARQLIWNFEKHLDQTTNLDYFEKQSLLVKSKNAYEDRFSKCLDK